MIAFRLCCFFEPAAGQVCRMLQAYSLQFPYRCSKVDGYRVVVMRMHQNTRQIIPPMTTVNPQTSNLPAIVLLQRIQDFKPCLHNGFCRVKGFCPRQVLKSCFDGRDCDKKTKGPGPQSTPLLLQETDLGPIKPKMIGRAVKLKRPTKHVAKSMTEALRATAESFEVVGRITEIYLSFTYYELDFVCLDSFSSCYARNSHLAIFDNSLTSCRRIQYREVDLSSWAQSLLIMSQ